MKKRTTKKVRRHVRRSVRRFLQIITTLLVGIIIIGITSIILEDEDYNHCGAVTTYCNKVNPEVLQNTEKEYVWGIDISQWQKNLITTEWLKEAKKAELQFVYIQIGRRSPETLELQDLTSYAYNYAMMCEEAQIPFGFYFLTEAQSSEQALEELSFIQSFYASISGKYAYHNFPLMIDVEERFESKEVTTQKGNAIKLLLRKLPSDTVLYIGTYRYAALNEYIPKGTTLWVADYRISKKEFHYTFDYVGGYFEMMSAYNMPHFFEPERIPDVKIWQYTADYNLHWEKGITTDEQPLDRNLMAKEYYDKYVNP